MSNQFDLSQAISFMLTHAFCELIQKTTVSDLTKLVHYNNNKSILEFWNIHTNCWEQWSPCHYDLSTTFYIRTMEKLPDLFYDDKWDLVDGIPSIVTKEGEVWKGIQGEKQYQYCVKALKRYEIIVEEYEKRWEYKK